MTEENPDGVDAPETTPSPAARASTDSQRKRTTDQRPFPTRLSSEDFPHKPFSNGRLPLTLENVAHLLTENDVEVHYDVIRKEVFFRRSGQKLEASDLIGLANLNQLGSRDFVDFVATLAQRNPINPVADWIDSVAWDGTDRLQALFATVQVDEEYPTLARDFLLRRWLLSCVAAALVPSGFKARGVLVLQGEQGLGKTSWIARLVPKPQNARWIKLDHHLDAHSKDSIFGAMQHWIVEIGELDSSFRKDIARIKGLLTNDCDKLRLPYARSPIELPRRTVFAGTVNEWHFLIDQTGNSRWWTIPVVGLDFEHEIDMQQVFAQLAVDYRKGEEWWLTNPEEALLASLNSQHQAVSVIEERVRQRVASTPTAKHRYMTATQVLEEVGFRSPSNSQCKECGAILRSLYGPPKRVNGLMKWKVALTPEEVWQKHPEHDPRDEDEY